MEFVKAIVKKYSREYTRTLKDGKKKKYRTEQVQITIPKEDDMFTDNETVIIIKSSDMDKIKKDFSKTKDLKTKNISLQNDINIQKSTIEKNKSTIDEFEITTQDQNKKIDLLHKKLEKKSIEKENIEEKLEKSMQTIKNYENKINKLKSENNLIKNKSNEEKLMKQELSILEKDTIITKLNQEKKEPNKDKTNLEEKIDILKSHIEDMKKITATLQSSQNKENEKLEKKYNKLVIKYHEKKEALKEAEELAKYQEKIAKRLKEFILNSY